MCVCVKPILYTFTFVYFMHVCACVLWIGMFLCMILVAYVKTQVHDQIHTCTHTHTQLQAASMANFYRSAESALKTNSQMHTYILTHTHTHTHLQAASLGSLYRSAENAKKFTDAYIHAYTHAHVHTAASRQFGKFRYNGRKCKENDGSFFDGVAGHAGQ